MPTIEQLDRQIKEVERKIASINSLIGKAEQAVTATLEDPSAFRAASESLATLEQHRSSFQLALVGLEKQRTVAQRSALQQRKEVLEKERDEHIKLQNTYAAERDRLKQQAHEQDVLAHLYSDRAQENTVSIKRIDREMHDLAVSGVGTFVPQ